MRRNAWLPLLVLAVALVTVLLISALQSMRIRAFSLGAPSAGQVAVLAPAHTACEGPIRVPAGVGLVRVWGTGVGSTSQVEVAMRNARSGNTIARGLMVVQPELRAYDALLNGSAPSGSIVQVCLTPLAHTPVSLYGSGPAHPGVLMSVAGKPTSSEFSLVLFERSRHSLLAALPLAFSRAALFRFGWIGAWTFWVLTIALAATIVACWWAVAAADRADASDARPKGHPDASLASRLRD